MGYIKVITNQRGNPGVEKRNFSWKKLGVVYDYKMTKKGGLYFHSFFFDTDRLEQVSAPRAGGCGLIC